MSEWNGRKLVRENAGLQSLLSRNRKRCELPGMSLCVLVFACLSVCACLSLPVCVAVSVPVCVFLFGFAGRNMPLLCSWIVKPKPLDEGWDCILMLQCTPKK